MDAGGEEGGADGGLGFAGGDEGVFDVAVHERRFADALAAEDDNLDVEGGGWCGGCHLVFQVGFVRWRGVFRGAPAGGGSRGGVRLPMVHECCSGHVASNGNARLEGAGQLPWEQYLTKRSECEHEMVGVKSVILHFRDRPNLGSHAQPVVTET